MSDITSRLSGIHASIVLPMRPDFAMDDTALAAHIRHVTGTPGIRGLLVNGHAGENFVATIEEQCRVVAIARTSAPPGCLIVSGVNRESSLAAAHAAASLQGAGADILLVFPPNSWALGYDAAAVAIHHAYVRDATSCPLLIYGAPIGAGAMAYPPAVLMALAREKRIVGIKEGSWETAAYEANRRRLKAARPDFVVLGSGDEHLLACNLIGSEGSQVSLAAVIPRSIVALWDACTEGNLATARALHECIYPLAVAVYRDPPPGRATARLKACLRILGRIDCAAVRPPQPPASAEECRALERALYITDKFS
jgi:4-hydroxy-tetrahydrodipicolinate synthase